MRSRGLAVGFLIVVLAACVGAYAAWRVSNSRLGPSGPAWQPPTPAAAVVSPTAASAVPTAVVVPTVAVPTNTPAPALTSTPTTRLRSSPTPTLVGSTATPSPTSAPVGSYRFLPVGSVRHTTGGCPGLYVMGDVWDARGNPLPGVRLRNTDQWGNEAFTTTKSGAGDLGHYDFPLFPPDGMAVTYRLVVLDEAGRPASPVVSVPHHHQGPYRDASCHWLDWQEVE